MSYTNNLKRNHTDVVSHRKHYQPRVEILDYNILIDGRNFYDQNINDPFTRYTELLKLTAGRPEDATTGCLISYGYYLKDWNIAEANLS